MKFRVSFHFIITISFCLIKRLMNFIRCINVTEQFRDRHTPPCITHWIPQLLTFVFGVCQLYFDYLICHLSQNTFLFWSHFKLVIT
jgi:hypothetical protein